MVIQVKSYFNNSYICLTCYNHVITQIPGKPCYSHGVRMSMCVKPCYSKGTWCYNMVIHFKPCLNNGYACFNHYNTVITMIIHA